MYYINLLKTQFFVLFTVNLNLIPGMSPRILIGKDISYVTILESRDAHGYFSFRDVTVRTKESGNDGSDVLFTMVTIERTGLQK